MSSLLGITSKILKFLELNEALTIAERYMEYICFIQKALRAKVFDRSYFLSLSGPKFLETALVESLYKDTTGPNQLIQESP